MSSNSKPQSVSLTHPPNDSNEEAPLLSHTAYSEEPWRIWNLILFVLISAVADIQFYGFSMVTTQVAQLYRVSLTLNFWYSSAFLLCPLLLFLPVGVFASTHSVKATLFLGYCFAILGSWFKCLINTSFFFSFAGHYLVASSYAFF